MVRGWHIKFWDRQERKDVIGIFLTRYPPFKLFGEIGRKALAHVLEFKGCGDETLGFIEEICKKYKTIPSDDATITLTHSNPDSDAEEGMFGIMQLSSGSGSQRKVKNVIRLEVLYLLMRIADDLEIEYTCYSG